MAVRPEADQVGLDELGGEGKVVGLGDLQVEGLAAVEEGVEGF